MTKIQSGTTRERLLRTLVLALLVTGYAAYSLYDGYVAYPKANVDEVFEKKLGRAPAEGETVIHANVTSNTVNLIEQGMSASDVEAEVGTTGIADGDHRLILGRGGYLDVEWRRDRVVGATWVEGPLHRPADLLLQKIIGFSLLPIVLWTVIRLVRALRTRVVLDETALQVRGREPVPVDAITAVEAGRHAEEFVVTWDRDGSPAQLTLDAYVVRRLPDMVDEICRRRGLDHPRATGDAKSD